MPNNTRKLPPDTPEQSKITCYTGKRLVVKAYAGTGKTTTLVKYALNNLDSRILYLAYNRAIRDEAREKFPANVDCKTSHQLAYATIGKKYQHKLTGNLNLTAIAQALNTKNWTFAKDVLDTLNAFMYSADMRILYNHFDRIDTGKPLTSKQEKYRIQVVEGAELVWKRMINIQDPFPTVHDCYLKQYQLSLPNLSRRYTTILFDEAQDSNPVTSSIVLHQSCKVILVGDSHQQIYRFRGANNALDSKKLVNADRLYLTHSFRFGSNISIVANALLELKGERRPVVGHGPEDKVVMSLPKDVGHRAILHRTVMGVISTALTATNLGEKVFWVGGIDAYQITDLQDLYWFSRNKPSQIKNKKLLDVYEDYSKYQEITKATKNPEMIRAVKIIKKYKDLPARLNLLWRNTVNNEREADITVSTAHRCKGLEWDFVQLYNDFPDVLDPDLDPLVRNDEINLLYVASTRAMRILALNSALELVIRHITQKRLAKKQMTA